MNQSQYIPYDQICQINSLSFVSAVSTRFIILIKSKNPKIGRIGIIFIGMTEVSSCISIVNIGQ